MRCDFLIKSLYMLRRYNIWQRYSFISLIYKRCKFLSSILRSFTFRISALLSHVPQPRVFGYYRNVCPFFAPVSRFNLESYKVLTESENVKISSSNGNTLIFYITINILYFFRIYRCSPFITIINLLKIFFLKNTQHSESFWNFFLFHLREAPCIKSCLIANFSQRYKCTVI